jgi:hypothetical protein
LVLSALRDLPVGQMQAPFFSVASLGQLAISQVQVKKKEKTHHLVAPHLQSVGQPAMHLLASLGSSFWPAGQIQSEPSFDSIWPGGQHRVFWPIQPEVPAGQQMLLLAEV